MRPQLRRPGAGEYAAPSVVSVVEPGILGRIGRKRENHAGQERAEQRDAAATVSRHTRASMAAPVRQAHP